MKYLILLCDGMADLPIEALGGKTPMEAAVTPTFNRWASEGELGCARTVPAGMTPASDVANLSVMGYDPAIYYAGRSPLEAVSMGVDLADNEVCFRCNLVTLSEKEQPYAEKMMIDHSSDEISTAEAAELMHDLSEKFGNTYLRFHTGRSYRHVMVWQEGSEQVTLTPPHDILGKPITAYLPKGDNHAEILAMMEESYRFLSVHPLNLSRKARGLRPANSMWIWGEGHRPRLSDFQSKFGIEGGVISAVDLILGIGICAGLEPMEVEGANGTLHTNYRGKAEKALEAFRNGKDFVYLHVEAPDECGHRGELENKIRSIEYIDQKVAAPIMEAVAREGFDLSVLVLPDHPTPLALRTHTTDPIPYLIWRSHAPVPSGTRRFSEATGIASGRLFEKGHELLDYFIQSSRLTSSHPQ
ncbi:MAG: cofactor-independent phosphoglycerate mutase [Bacteroidales bacterium]